MRASRKVLSEGAKFYKKKKISVDGGIEDPNTALIRPSLAHQQNAIKMVLPWWADDGPTLNAGLNGSLNCNFSGDPEQYWKETLYFFFTFSGWVPDPVHPLLILPCNPSSDIRNLR